MKTSLGIWAFGSMVTRFVPGGYQPERAGETTVQRVRRAVDGLGDLIDGYEFHYPQELSEENLDEVREALGDHGIYCLAGGPPSRPALRQGRLRQPRSETCGARRCGSPSRVPSFAGQLGVPMIIWPGIEGYNYPFQTPYTESWAWFIDGLGAVAGKLAEHGQPLWLEHKNSEPAMKILMRNIGMTLHVIHKLRARASTTSRSTWTGST